jgi:hypothetical protein
MAVKKVILTLRYISSQRIRWVIRSSMPARARSARTNGPPHMPGQMSKKKTQFVTY